MVLHWKLYSRAKINPDALNEFVLFPDKTVDGIIEAVYKMDLPSVEHASYSDYLKLPNICRYLSRTYADHEDRFCAALSELNSNGESVPISFTSTARSLIHDTNIDAFQHFGVMSTAMSSIKALKP